MHLVQSGRCPFVIAADLRCGPLQKAQALAQLHGVQQQVSCRLGDGLSVVRAGEVQDIVIAGMGGENIADILSRAPWTKEGRLLVLQPMSKADVLRRFLFEHGYRVETERLVEDGPVYELLTARGGKEDTPPSPAELLTGRFALIRDDPLFPARLEHLLEVQRRAVAGLEHSSKPGDAARLTEEKITLASLLEMRERMEAHA